jgi:HTH-type transcriptional regulator / antitoxin HigA
MEEKVMSLELQQVEKVWPLISNVLSIPRNQDELIDLSNILDELIDEIGNSENHKLASLMEIIGLLIEKYEDEHHQIPKISGVDVLKELMIDKNLKQSDLSELGSQGVVSEILNGKRELNIRQIKTLAEKFSVSPSVFI